MSMIDIVIVGAGGLGREVLFQLREINSSEKKYNVMGFVDDLKEKGTVIHNLPVLGDTNWLAEYDKSIAAVVCVGNSKVRRTIAEKIMKNGNVNFPNIFADDFRCSDTVEFGRGCIVNFSCIATVDIKVGDFSLISNDCTIGHDSRLGEFVTLFPSVNISGNVFVGNCVEIGVGSNVIQGKSIGENAVIGAGAVVITDIPKSCTAVGVPAKVIHKN